MIHEMELEKPESKLLRGLQHQHEQAAKWTRQSRSRFTLSLRNQYIVAFVCSIIIAYAFWRRLVDEEGISRPLPRSSPLSKLIQPLNLNEFAASQAQMGGGSGDEFIFDEDHQRGIVSIYGRPGSSYAGGADEDNPYAYPGMTPNELPSEWDYGMTIDCGSKGSRLHIYKWQHRHSATSIPPFTPLFTKHAWSERVGPGISTFVDAPEMVIPQLVTLLEFAKNSLSEFRHKWPRTPVYVKATAGMRLIKNLPSRDRIMETIRAYLSDPVVNPFYFERTMARVISGEEEGVYGWMTANYLSGTLLHSSSANSLGALDMGGASVQITFRPPFDVLSNYFPLRIQQEKIRLYSHSFLNFGIDLALQRVNDRLIEVGLAHAVDQNAPINYDTPTEDDGAEPGKHAFLGVRDGVRVFRHPCFPLGYSFTYVYVSDTDLRASYTGVGASDDENGIDMSPITTYSEANAKREMVQFEGSQEYISCSRITWQLLHKRAPCFDNTCSFDGIYQPRFGNVTFLAFSEFSKVVLGDLGLNHNATLKDIDLKTREMCAYSWQQLQDTHRYSKIDDLSKLCFNARYIFTVLYKGFGFPYEGNNLIFVNSVLGLDLNWAMGSTLYEANAMPWDIVSKKGENFHYQMGPSGNHQDRLSNEEQADSTAGGKKPSKKEQKAMQKLEKKQEKSFLKARSKSRLEQERNEEREAQEEMLPHTAAPDTPPSNRPEDNEPINSGSSPSSGGDQVRTTKRNAVPSSSSTSATPNASPVGSPQTATPVAATSPWNSAVVWALFGFLIGGWLITAVAFFVCMRQARKELRHMEESGLRYEPIHQP